MSKWHRRSLGDKILIVLVYILVVTTVLNFCADWALILKSNHC